MTRWRTWLRPRGSANRPAPSVGEGTRVYAIGDIHGRADLLDALLSMIGQDDAVRTLLPPHIVFLGDFINRGPSSRQVVERAMALSATGGDIRCLKGNHEEVFVLAARGDARAIPIFRRMEGAATLVSYGLDEADYSRMDDDDIAAWMLTHIPRDHVDFIDAMNDFTIIGDYLFVHAGVRPRKPIEEQDGADLRWIRQEFLSHRAMHPWMVVHGHTISEDVDERPNRIGIDTGAYQSGRLTAIGLEGSRRWFLQTS